MASNSKTTERAVGVAAALALAVTASPAAGRAAPPEAEPAMETRAPAEPLSPAAPLSGPASTAPLSSPEELARAVLIANPELETIEAQIVALEQAVRQADVWADPRLAVDYSNVPLERPYPGAHPMSGVQLQLQQVLPAPGKLPAREAVASGRVRVARHQLRDRRNALVGQVEDLYHRLALARQLRLIRERHVRLVGELIGVAQASYEAGEARQHDLLQLHVLRDRLVDDLDELSRQDRELLAALNAALHRLPGSPVATPERTELPPAPPPLERLVGAAEASRPLVEQLEEAARTESLAATRAELEGRPDVTVSLGYRMRFEGAMGDPGEDLVSAGLSIPLPWFWNDRRWGALAAQHLATRRSLEQQRAAAIDEIRGRLEAALARLHRGSERALRYEEEIVPAQRRTLDSTLADYQVGRAEFAKLYQAELSLLELESTIHGARAESVRAAVEIATLTGGHVAKEGVR